MDPTSTKIADTLRSTEKFEYTSPQLCYAMLMTMVNDHKWVEKNPVLYYPESQKTAVIIDPRYDTLMRAVICNFMFFMNPEGWNLCIVSHPKYETKIKADFPNSQFEAIDESRVHYNEAGVPNITIDHYNAFLTSAAFWEKRTEHIAIFQKDCIMFRMFPRYFADYDFAGANFYGAVSPRYGGINGGFSVRKRSAMLECIEKVSMDRVYRYHPEIQDHPHRTNEDVYFTHACEILNKLVPDKIHRTFLAIEDDYTKDTSVIHGWSKYAKNIDFVAYILSKSPLFSKYIAEKSE